MEAAPDVAAALTAARAIGFRTHGASDDALIADGVLMEELGRVVDAHRLAFAAEVERRSKRRDGVSPISWDHGARDGIDLVAQTARISRATARRRVGLGSALAPDVTLRDDLVPGRFGVLAAAVDAGEVGIDSARVIVEHVLHMQSRITEQQFAEAVAELTETARATDTELVVDTADRLAATIDPDGAEPTERNQHRQRSFKIGRTGADGMTPARALLTPEHLALISELLQSARRSSPLIRTTPGGDETTEQIEPEWREGMVADGDEPRSRAQQDYDSLIDAVQAGVLADQATGSVHEVVVHVTAADVEARRGQGWVPGLMAALPIPTIERWACSGGTRLLVTGDDGEALFFSHEKRLFTSAQKKILIARSGGRCEFPGCTATAPFLEAHHVAWFTRDRGSTDLDNGIMLCSHHHHLIHSTVGRIEIRRWEGDLWFVPERHRGDPKPEHRRQTGPRVRATGRHGPPG